MDKCPCTQYKRYKKEPQARNPKLRTHWNFHSILIHHGLTLSQHPVAYPDYVGQMEVPTVDGADAQEVMFPAEAFVEQVGEFLET